MDTLVNKLVTAHISPNTVTGFLRLNHNPFSEHELYLESNITGHCVFAFFCFSDAEIQGMDLHILVKAYCRLFNIRETKNARPKL